MKTRRLLFAAVAMATGATVYAETNEIKTDSLSEVVVTGTNNAMKSKYVPYSISMVDSEQIEATGRTQLLSALSGRIPSLFVTERNIFGFGVSTGGSGGIKLRGVGGSPTSQVLMMVDGKPQFSGVFSHPVADNYESDMVDHVEVVRGPASVLYGSNAMGGAINLITKKQKVDGVHTTIESQYGMWNTSQSRVSNTTRFGKFSSLVSAGFDRTDGTQKDFDFWQASAYAKVGYDFTEHWNAYVDYSFMKFKGNDPIYAPTFKGTDDIYHQDILRGEASLVVGYSYEKTNGAVRVYFGHGNHKIEDPNAFQSLDNRIGVLAYHNYQPWKMTNITIGFDFDRYMGEVPLSGGVKRADKITPATMDKQTIIEYSRYFTVTQGIWDNLLVLNAGIRVANSNMFGTQCVPQGGFAVNPGLGFTVKGSVSKGYRNPSFKELYLYKMANADLKPENMMNYEVSLGKSFSNWLTLELTGYYSKGKNLIQIVAGKNENTGAFCNKGVEFTANSHPIDNLWLRGSYSFLKTDIVNLTGAPKYQYSFGADWRVIPQLLINADVTGVADMYVSKSRDKESYALLNLRATYTPVKFLDVFVQGNNLANVHYQIMEGYDMPGVNVTGGVKVRF